MTATVHLSSQHALQQNGQRVLDWLFPPEGLLLSRALMPTFEPRDEAKAFLFYTDNIRKKQLHGFRWQMSAVQLVIWFSWSSFRNTTCLFWILRINYRGSLRRLKGKFEGDVLTDIQIYHLMKHWLLFLWKVTLSFLDTNSIWIIQFLKLTELSYACCHSWQKLWSIFYFSKIRRKKKNHWVWNWSSC